MTAENALMVLIMAGMALCGAYFWAELARRRRERVRAEQRLRALQELTPEPLLVQEPWAVRSSANDSDSPAPSPLLAEGSKR